MAGYLSLTRTKGSCWREHTGVKLNNPCFMLMNRLSLGPKSIGVVSRRQRGVVALTDFDLKPIFGQDEALEVHLLLGKLN